MTGAGSGIGRAIARELAGAGADVLVHANRSREAAETLFLEIRALGVQAELVLLDLAVAANQDSLVERAFQWGDGPDIWINNAGVDILSGPLAKAPFEERLESLLQLDVSATLRLSRAFVTRRQKQPGPKPAALVNFGWDCVDCGMAGDSAQLFAAAKGAVTAFTRSLAQTAAPAVRVNCVAPGWIRTGWAEQASDYWHRRGAEESLLERWGTPDDVARVVRFLVSPAGEFVNGQVLPINGGRRCHL